MHGAAWRRLEAFPPSRIPNLYLDPDTPIPLKPPRHPAWQGDVRVFEGHAFLVEAAVSVGGRDMKPGLNIYRWGAARSWGLDVAPVETN